MATSIPVVPGSADSQVPGTPTLPASLGGNPFPGPRPFTRAERACFFGRDAEARELVALLVAERIVLLYSPSGAGKTSLIEARVRDALEQKRFDVFPLIRLGQSLEQTEPVLSPNRYLNSALHCLGLADRVAPDFSFAAQLNLHSRRPETRAEVLIFDQLEEVFTLDPTDLDAKQEFFRQVGEALASPEDPGTEDETAATGARPRWALFAIREEFVAALEPYANLLPCRLRMTFRLNLLDQEHATQAIRGPAELAEVQIEQTAAEWLCAELRTLNVFRPGAGLVEMKGHYVEPVHLQIVCQRLWGELSPGKTLVTTDDLKRMMGGGSSGNVDRILAEYYAAKVQSIAAVFPGTRQRDIRLWIDQFLITRHGLRGQIPQEFPTTQGLPNDVLDALVDARLLRCEPRNGINWVELSHDRLVRPIKMDNDAWYEQHLSPLEHAARAWLKAGKPDTLLLRGEGLKKSEEWEEKHAAELDETVRDFLRAGRKQRAREHRRWWLVLGFELGLLVVIFVAIAISLLVARNRELKIVNARTDSNHLAAQAQLISRDDPDLGLLLAYRAWETFPNHKETSAAKDVLINLLAPGGRVLVGHEGMIRQIGTLARRDANQQPRWLVTVGADARTILWDFDRLRDGGKLEDGENRYKLRDHAQAVSSFAASADGEWLATASVDGSIQVYQVADKPRRVARLTKPSPATINRVFLLPTRADLRPLWVCGTTSDGRLWCWRLVLNELRQTGPRNLPPEYWEKAHDGRINAAQLSQDGRYLATAGSDRKVRLYWLDKLIGSQEKGKGAPRDFTRELEVAENLADLELTVVDNDAWLVGASSQELRLWQLRALEAGTAGATDGQTFSSAQGGVEIIDIAISRDGKWLITGSEDGAVHAWDFRRMTQGYGKPGTSGQPASVLARRLVPHTGTKGPQNSRAENPGIEAARRTITDIALSADSRWLAASSDGKIVDLWQPAIAGGAQPWELKHSLYLDNGVRTMAFVGASEDLLLVMGCEDESARVWRLNDLAEQAQSPLRADFSPRERHEKLQALVKGRKGATEFQQLCLDELGRRLNQAAVDDYIKKAIRDYHVEHPGWFGNDYILKLPARQAN